MDTTGTTFNFLIVGLKFPNYDPSKDIEDTRAAFKPLYEQAEELAAFSEKRIKEINAELKALETEKVRRLLLRAVCGVVCFFRMQKNHILGSLDVGRAPGPVSGATGDLSGPYAGEDESADN